ncbi:MAG TPA: mechanosensitive ion channel family protein [Trebonia sp.]|nr:mechanosensitive ion channel family protein [Trebonia sp.]
MTESVGLHMWLAAVAYLGTGLISALGLRVILTKLQRKAADTKWRAVVTSFLRTVAPWCAAASFAWGAVLVLPFTSGYRHDLDQALVALIVVVVSIGGAKIAGEAVHAGAVSHAGTSGSATIFVSITRIIVWTIGALVLLDSLGIAITPLLTALGVGGLAVALALQDTLSNLFAGLHILASRKVQPGDFIQLDNGMQGYVVDTNWRNTILRQLPNNLLVVPNATVASSIVTNFHLPEHELSVTVQAGVGYDSDLEQVERVTIEVGREVMQGVEGAVPAHEPSIRYTGFGGSSINFNVGLRAAEVTTQAVIVHEFIKRLHRRYQKEGIDFQSPNETIVYSAPDRRDDAEFGQLMALDPEGR